MKIVINTCFGGFGLSPRGYKEVAKLLGRKCYFFESSFGTIERYKPVKIKYITGLFFNAFDIPNPNEVITYGKKWSDQSMEERRKGNDLYESHKIPDFDEDRSNPILIEVVEKLGEKANGRCAELKIVEIPDGVDWEIDEYDGRESIEEKHQSWT